MHGWTMSRSACVGARTRDKVGPHQILSAAGTAGSTGMVRGAVAHNLRVIDRAPACCRVVGRHGFR